ncbi:histidine--tRNA ligase [Helicovermis profundi]|uniref:Histidine--tRNA ligase n=1 Tax=Helicovermis profundi TaxID=3065157 RepID=A0AAU9E6T5_9FIRM|nr:histidine--tRNA ligase [Clostridia bacterium S502]
MIIKPKGTKDVLPKDIHKWLYVEEKFREICNLYSYSEIRTPLFEFTKLFKRGVGETTDIVKKEMYTAISGVDLKKYRNDSFDIDKKGFTLKPEGTAPVVRAFTENKLYADSQPTKLFYITPCFRHERPQAGRLREFHQFGIEAFSSNEASVDAEVISLADTYLRKLGLTKTELRINSIGCKVCRPNYHKELKSFLKSKLNNLCETCNERFITNPMRILDCKNPSCQSELTDAPVMMDYLCDECSDHFKSLKSNLDSMEISYIVDPRIVRGLDYYTKTAFEFISNDIGAQSTVCGGGRYDGLVEEIGGPSTPGVGFGMGIERLLLTLEQTDVEIENKKTMDVFIVSSGKDAKLFALKISQYLRTKNISCDIDHLSRSMKSQFKYADKLGAKFVIIIGEDEVSKGTYLIKNMNDGIQTEYKDDELYKINELVNRKGEL